MRGINRRTFFGMSALAGLATASVAGCSRSGGSGSAGAAEVSYTFMATKNLADVAVVQEAINVALKAKGRDYTVRLDAQDSETFKTRTPLALTAGNASDVLFTAPWANDYYTHASTGNFLALDDLLSSDAPELRDAIDASLWSVPVVGGETFAVPNQQLFPGTWGVLAQAELVDKYGFDLGALTSYEDLEPLLAEIKAGESGMTVLYSDSSGAGQPGVANEFSGWDVSLNPYGLAVHADDPEARVFIISETDEYRVNSELARRWRDAGYYDPNPAESSNATSAWNSGTVAVRLNQADRSYTFPFEVAQKNLTPPILTTGSILGTLTAISRTASNPTAAIQWIEDLTVDREIYNLLCFGVEGTHYEFTDESLGVVQPPEGITSDTSRWDPNSDWMFGNQFNAFYRTMAEGEAKRWEKESSLNDAALRSTLLGFTFDPDSIKTEAASVGAIVTERNQQLGLGLVDPSEAIPDTIDRLKTAGIETIRDEAQRQIDDWKANS